MKTATKTECGIECSCGSTDSHILRTTNQRGYIVRRRECLDCGARTTTVERPINEAPPDVTATCSALLETSIGQIADALRLFGDASGGTLGKPAFSPHDFSKPTR